MIDDSMSAIWIMVALLKQPEWAGLHERLEKQRGQSLEVRNSGRRSLMLNELAERGDEEVLRFMEAHRLAHIKQRLLGQRL